MLIDRIKDIVKDSSIYGLSKILGQLISFFLIPVYTSYLTPADYGILSLIGIAISSITLLMTFGLNSAIFRYVGLTKDENAQMVYVANAQMLTITTMVLFTGLSLIFLNRLNAFIVNTSSPVSFLLIGMIVAICGTISAVPHAYLRIKRRVKVIALASIINLIVSIMLTILFLVILKLGVVGALLGNLGGALLSSIFVMVFVTGIPFSKFSWPVSKALLSYSLPVLPHQIFVASIPIYSQWSVKELISMKDLGLYAVALKFTLPVSALQGMFQQSYSAYKFEILSTDPNPKGTFSRILNIYILGMGTLVLMVAFFGGEILKLMTNISYHQAFGYVFYITLIPLGQGLFFMLGTGVEFAKSPIFRPVISGLGFLTVVLTNGYLIRTLGVPGAAISITLGWIIMTIGGFIYAQTIYPIKYNWVWVISYTSVIILVSFILNEDRLDYLVIKLALATILLSTVTYLAINKYKLLDLIRRPKTHR